jgi:hypothetical protein
MAYQEYIGQIVIATASKDFNIDDGVTAAQDVSLTVGEYYADGYSGDTQLCEHMQAQIRASHATYNASTVARNSDGKVEITFAGTPSPGNVTVTWTDTALGTLLGFTSALSGATTYAADVTPKGVWRPSMPLSETPGDETTWWSKRSTTKVTVSLDGSTYSVEGDLLYDGIFRYENLPVADVLETSSTTWTTFESLWENVVHEARPIRILPDRDSYTSSTHKTGLIVPADAEMGGDAVTIGHVREYQGRTVDSYNGLWDVEFKMVKSVTAG